MHRSCGELAPAARWLINAKVVHDPFGHENMHLRQTVDELEDCTSTVALHGKARCCTPTFFLISGCGSASFCRHAWSLRRSMGGVSPPVNRSRWHRRMGARSCQWPPASVVAHALVASMRWRSRMPGKVAQEWRGFFRRKHGHAIFAETIHRWEELRLQALQGMHLLAQAQVSASATPPQRAISCARRVENMLTSKCASSVQSIKQKAEANRSQVQLRGWSAQGPNRAASIHNHVSIMHRNSDHQIGSTQCWMPHRTSILHARPPCADLCMFQLSPATDELNCSLRVLLHDAEQMQEMQAVSHGCNFRTSACRPSEIKSSVLAQMN